MGTSPPMSVGAFADGTYLLNGRVDELALYKRVLTSTERTWLYNAGRGRTYADATGTVQYHAVTGGVTSGGCPQGETCDYDQAQTGVNNTYGYDLNGNQTTRVINGVTLTLSYDADGRMVSVTGQGITASFIYDGDGKRVKSAINGTATYFVGSHYEVSDGVVTKYYYAGSSRVAMKTGTSIYYLLSDHLGSTSLTTDEEGNFESELRYGAWGNVRYSNGSTPTNYTFTAQYSDSYINLLDYGSRRYDPEIGRFISPDSIVPLASQGVQAWDRYGYANNNPIRYTDPTGHCIDGISTWVCLGIVLVTGTVILSADNPLPEPTNFPINATAVELCGSSLPDCFGDTVYLKDFSEHGEDNPIPLEEFEAFADEVAEDLYNHDLTWPGLKAGRGAYDTPFYNGGESERRGGPDAPQGVFPADQHVCIETIGCSGRSEINYIAQGMWGAATNETKPVSIAITWTWKLEEYFKPPSEGTMFWLKYGYDYYKQWFKENEK